MSTKYGRVTQPDKLHLSDPADAHEYTDDINGNGYNRNGSGIYNDPVYTVEVTPKTYRDSFRIACFRCQNTRRNKFMLFGGLIIVALTLILIIVAASHHAITKANSPNAERYGLIAYGPDKKGVMNFNPADAATYADEKERIEDAMHEYSAEKQLSDVDKYMNCNENTTEVPDSKVCRQTAITFGDHCHKYNIYGLFEGQPCVLLVLKLKKDMLPVPMDTYDANVPQERYSNLTVGISCAGKTQLDSDNLGIGGSKLQGPPVDYNPPKGFPLYYFSLRNNNDDWVSPAVMVQFNDVVTHEEVKVKCTAWAQNFNDGEPQYSSVYSTEFKFDIFMD